MDGRLPSCQSLDHLAPWYAYFGWTLDTLIKSGALLATVVGAGYLAVRYASDRDPPIAMLVFWWLLPVLAMSVLSSKQVHYLYPFLPPLAVMAAVGLTALWGRCIKSPSFVNWAVLLLVFLPIAKGYPGTLKRMRVRPELFSELRSCLDRLDHDPRVRSFFAQDRAATHAYAYYDLVEYIAYEGDALRDSLLGNDPRPVWLTQAQFQGPGNAVVRGSVDALLLPSAVIYSTPGPGAVDTAVLLLPDKFRACTPTLIRHGARVIE